MSLDECFKIYNLRLSKVQWILFGIDVIKKKCYVIELIRNFSSETKILQIEEGRSLWRHLIKKGYSNISLKEAGHIPSLVSQRIKEWNSFSYNEFNGWKKKRRLINPWIKQPQEFDSEKNLENLESNVSSKFGEENFYDFWEGNEESIAYQDGRVTEKIEEFGDFDNYWNQEGVFEKETDIDIDFDFPSQTYQNNNYENTISDYKENLESEGLSHLLKDIYADQNEVYLLTEVENYINSGDYSEALKITNKLLKENNYLERAYISRGVIKSQLKDEKGAIEDYSRAIEINPKNYISLYNRGFSKAELNDHQGAIDDFSKSLLINDQNINALFNRAYSRAELNDHKGAIKDYTSVIEINPKSENAFINRGVAKSNLQDNEGAIQDYSNAIKINPKNKTSFHNRGLRKASLGLFSDAIIDYSEAIEISPNFELAFIDRGVSKGMINDHQGAIEDYSNAIKINPENSRTFFKRGYQKLVLNLFDESIDDFTFALKINPYYQEAYLNRGVSRANKNQHEGAIADYTTSLELNPKDKTCLINRGLSKATNKDHLGAISDFSSALDIDPDSSKAYFNRAISNSYLELYDSAFSDFDNGLRFDPNNLEFLYLAGMLKYEVGDFDGCIHYLSNILYIRKDYKDVDIFLKELKSNLNKGKSTDEKPFNDSEDKVNQKSQNSKDKQVQRNKELNNFIDLNSVKGELKKLINSKKIKTIRAKIPMLENLFAKKQKISRPDIAPIKNNEVNKKENLTTLIKELESYVGLNSVKNEINKIVNFQKIQNERIKLGLGKETYSKHMVFYGPPGTGKSEIARLVGRIFNSLGVLSQGHFIETDRSSFVAGHIGQTAIKTKTILDQSLGGILFIDEAYALTKNQENWDFGDEAISTILKYMEDHRDDLVVIVAGYENEMNDFLSANPGLKSRFNSFLSFPNYKENELLQILIKLSKDRGYFIKTESEELLKNKLAKISEFRSSQFGNARSMRNLLEIAIKNQASRIMSKKIRNREDLQYLESEDFELNEDEYSNL